MVKVIKAHTLKDAFDLSPKECVVEPQYEVELAELKEKKRKPTSAAKAPSPE